MTIWRYSTRPLVCLRPLVGRRLLSTESSLAKLRKKTGFAFSLCRKALDLHDQDVVRAEEWLRAEAVRQGFVKANLLFHRKTSEGLVGLHVDRLRTLATAIEVNCESDFVARSENFRNLVTEMSKNLATDQPSGGQKQDGDRLSRVDFSADDLSTFSQNSVAGAIQKLGENIKLSRGVLVTGKSSSGDLRLVGYTHSVSGVIKPDQDNVMLGKYAAIVALRPTAGEDGKLKTDEELDEIGKQLGQHIIGMRPATIEPKNEDLEDEPTALMQQAFVFDEDLTVAEFLKEAHVEVVDFVRVECGEEVEQRQDETACGL